MFATQLNDNQKLLFQRLPRTITMAVWFDLRDHVWRGVVREFSLFAQGASEDDVLETLRILTCDYVDDAIENGDVGDLIPRPLSDHEWRRIEGYLYWLRAYSRVRRMFTRGQSPLPTLARVIPQPCPL